MTVPTITAKDVKTESLNILNTLSKKGSEISWPTFNMGSVMFFVLFFTSVALLFSGALLFIGVILFLPFVAISVLAAAAMPFVMAGVANEYLLYSRGGLSIKSFALGVCCLVSFLIIPYIGFVLLIVLFIYCFGIICECILKGYLMYKGNVA